MARRTNDADPPQAKGNMRVLYVELNGNDSTLQEGLRTLVAAMRKQVHVSPPTKQISAAVQPVTGEPELDQPTLFDTEAEENSDAGNAEPGTVEESGTEKRQRRGDGQKIDRNAGLELQSDLDFVPDGKISLKSFLAEKEPSTAEEQILVFAHYMQHTMALQKFGPNHILSCFKHVAKKVPVDLRQTIRNMKKNKAWLNFSDINDLRVTTEGDNHVEHELGKNSDEPETEGG